MLNKRGQLTIFIIIAAVIVGIGLLVFIFWPSINSLFMSEAQATELLASKIEPMRETIQSCVYPVAESILMDMGLKAGYYDTSHLFTINYAGDKVIVMYKDIYNNRINKLPSLQQVKDQFVLGLETEGYRQIDSCIKDFASYRRFFDVSLGRRELDLQFEDDNVLVTFDWSITISKKGASLVVSPTPAVVPLQFGRAWSVANDIINYEVQQINFETVADRYNWLKAANREHLKIDTMRYPTSNQVIYMITSIPFREHEKEFKFYFAVNRI
ncbi:MAG: hypothetical protein ABH817_01105 [archaeon]